MTKNARDELERKRLDLELDRELEATFPASDALKITLRQSDSSEKASIRRSKRTNSKLWLQDVKLRHRDVRFEVSSPTECIG